MNYAYIRASSWTQALSPETQSEIIRDYARALKEEIPEENFFVDKATTSRIPLNQRPEGKILCSILKPGDNLFVLRMDRLFRSSSELEHYLKKWVLNPDGEVGLHFVAQGGGAINGTTSAGRLMMRMLAAFAEFERDLISDRTKESHAVQKQKRHRITRDPGVGFMWFYSGQKLNGSRLYLRIPNLEEMKLLESFNEWFTKGMSLSEISAHCRKHGIVRKFLRSKKIMGPEGKMVAKMAGMRTETEWVEEPWTRDSIYRGIKLVRGMDETQKKSFDEYSEEDGDEA